MRCIAAFTPPSQGCTFKRTGFFIDAGQIRAIGILRMTTSSPAAILTMGTFDCIACITLAVPH